MSEAPGIEPDANLVALGSRVRQLRAARRISQEDLGHAAGLHRTAVSAIEMGRRDFGVSNLWPLAEALGVSVTELLS